MKITQNTVVTLTYNLHLKGFEEPVIEKATKENPFQFIYGIGHMLSKFEENLKNLEPGDNFKFVIKYENAYGPYNEENVIDVPRDIFKEEDGSESKILKKGNNVTLQDSKGNLYDGTIKEIHDSSVTIDFNHPLAGEDLYFEGQIIDVRMATDEELAHGHVHDPNMHHHEDFEDNE